VTREGSRHNPGRKEGGLERRPRTGLKEGGKSGKSEQIPGTGMPENQTTLDEVIQKDAILGILEEGRLNLSARNTPRLLQATPKGSLRLGNRPNDLGLPLFILDYGPEIVALQDGLDGISVKGANPSKEHEGSFVLFPPQGQEELGHHLVRAGKV